VIFSYVCLAQFLFLKICLFVSFGNKAK
jgi:hypothetical protein